MKKNKTAQNIGLTYIVYISLKDVTSKRVFQSLRTTLTSIFNQTAPFCHLLVIAPQICGSKIQNIIGECIAIQENGISFHPLSQVKTRSNQNKTTGKNFFIKLYLSNSNDISVDIASLSGSIKTNWIVFVDIGVFVAAHATYELLRNINYNKNALIVYGDHDQIDRSGVRSNPQFNPIFSLDHLYCQNYIGSFFAVRKSCITNQRAIENSCSVESFTFDLILSTIEACTGQPVAYSRLRAISNLISHTPTILHSRLDARNSISRYHLNSLKKHFLRLYSGVCVEKIEPNLLRHRWPLPLNIPLVSLIIPTRDGYEILKKCIDSIVLKTTYKNYEIIIVDNQSKDKSTIDYLESLKRSALNKIRIIKYNRPFNYSALNNMAVKHSKGKLIGFLNNDIEVLNSDWLTEMVSHAIRPDIGCVGALHFYPDMNIQHAGVVVGMHGVADHAFKGLARDTESDSQGYLRTIRNPDAVTAATLLLKRELFDFVGGFDGSFLKIAFNDVDLCLKLRSQGYRCLWTPYAEFIHHESQTRRLHQSDHEAQTELFEHRVMKKRWQTDKWIKRDLLKYAYLGM